MSDPRSGTVSERHALHVIFVVDASGSMSGERMGSLNWAAKATVPAMREVAYEHPAVDVLVRVCRFSDAVDWPVPVPTPVDGFLWANLSAGGESGMGAALTAVASALTELEAAGGRNLPPVIVLLSDGLPSDDARAGLAALDATGLGRQAIRIPIAIGSDANLDILQAFIGPSALRPLRAHNAETLVRRMKWAATAPLRDPGGVQAGPGDEGGDGEPGHRPENEAAGGLVW